ncbi:MAG: phosphopyruvate hydratase [Gammaproteobacteria bacterium]|nr:phosphopyruvate hydratase [Gammaproteobacteria bacterium]
MVRIQSIRAREIIDSRGYPTVEVDVELKSGVFGRAAVPSGASTGAREALELRDHDAKRFHGKGVQQALAHVHDELSTLLLDKSFATLAEVDAAMIELDGSDNKSHLGANAILGISIALAKALAAERQQPFYTWIANTMGRDVQTAPVPLINVINGGAHADNGLDIQEFMIVPMGAGDVATAIRWGCEVYQTLKGLLKEQGLSVAVGDEGGFAPQLESAEVAFDILLQAIELAGYQPGSDIVLAVDAAASEWQDSESDDTYHWHSPPTDHNRETLIDYWRDVVQRYPLASIEDGLGESDWQGWQQLTKALGNEVQMVGDDLFVTNPKWIQQGIEQQAANAVLIKLNQIGTVSETLTAIKMAQDAGFAVVISHRSGETADHTIADLAVGCGAEQIKTGGLARSERLAKYNQLLRIDEACGGLHYVGADAFKHTANATKS